jgi:hypothetical protein
MVTPFVCFMFSVCMPHHRANPLVPHLLTVRVTFNYIIIYTHYIYTNPILLGPKSFSNKVGDLWHMVNPGDEKAIYEKMEVKWKRN